MKTSDFKALKRNDQGCIIELANNWTNLTDNQISKTDPIDQDAVKWLKTIKAHNSLLITVKGSGWYGPTGQLIVLLPEVATDDSDYECKYCKVTLIDYTRGLVYIINLMDQVSMILDNKAIHYCLDQYLTGNLEQGSSKYLPLRIGELAFDKKAAPKAPKAPKAAKVPELDIDTTVAIDSELLRIKDKAKTLLAEVTTQQNGNDKAQDTVEAFSKSKDTYMNDFFLLLQSYVKESGLDVTTSKNHIFLHAKVAVKGETAHMDKVTKKYKLDRGFKWISKKNESAGTLAVVTSNCNQIDKKTKGKQTIADFKTFGELRSAYQAILDADNKGDDNKGDDKEPKAKGKKTVTLTEAIATIKTESSVLGNFLEYAVKHGGLDSSDVIKGVAKIQRDMNESVPTPTRKESLSKALAH